MQNNTPSAFPFGPVSSSRELDVLGSEFGVGGLRIPRAESTLQPSCAGATTSVTSPLLFQGPAKPGSFLILILAPNGNSAKGNCFSRVLEDQGTGNGSLEENMRKRFSSLSQKWKTPPSHKHGHACWLDLSPTSNPKLLAKLEIENKREQAVQNGRPIQTLLGCT